MQKTMRRLFCAFGLLLVPLSALAVDYSKIDRTIAKEPVYTSGSPQYVLLLFGPEARVRVWVVFDGETVYLDRNRDGDLTGKDERFEKVSDCKDIEIADPDGKTNYLITSLQKRENNEKDRPPQYILDVNVDIQGPVTYQQYSYTELWENPRKAAIAHFHGPLTIGPRTILWKVPLWLTLQTGNQPVRLDAIVGTMDARCGCWVVVCSMKHSKNGGGAAFPEKYPLVNIEFPPQSSNQLPIIKTYPLEKFCCDAIFKDNIVAPAEAGTGTAKVTFSFDAWKEGHVMPSTVEIPVVTPEQAAELKKQAEDNK